MNQRQFVFLPHTAGYIHKENEVGRRQVFFRGVLSLYADFDEFGFRLPWRINGFSVNGKWTVVSRQWIVVGEIIDDFLNPYSVFGWLFAIGQESADVGVASGIDIDAECGYRLLGNGFDRLVRLVLVAFGVFCKRQIFFSNGGSRQCCVGWTLKTVR